MSSPDKDVIAFMFVQKDNRMAEEKGIHQEQQDLLEEQAGGIEYPEGEAESYIRRAVEIREVAAGKVSYERAVGVEQATCVKQDLWSEFLSSQTLLWIRWILFLPMTLLVGEIMMVSALVLARLLSRLPNDMFRLAYLNPIVWFIFAPAVFVLVGAKLAPKYKGNVLLILACYAGGLQGIGLVIQTIHRHSFSGTIMYERHYFVPVWWDMLTHCAGLALLVALAVQSRRLNSGKYRLAWFTEKE